MHVNSNNITNFDGFGVGNISKKIEKFIGNKNIKTNIYWIQAYNSIMCGYICTRFIDFMLKVKVCQIIPIYFILINIKWMTKW